MVLGGEDDALHSRLFANPRPLPAVQVAWVEQLRVLVAETPFLTGVGVERVVDEGIHLHALPSQLVLCRHRAAGIVLLCVHHECHRAKTDGEHQSSDR